MSEKLLENSYEVTVYNNYVVLRLIGDLNEDQAEDYIKQALPKVIDSKFDLIINCEFLNKLSPAWLRALTLTEQGVRKNQKKLRLIRVRDAIKILLVDKGLARILQINADLRDALLDLGLINKKSLNVGFINPFLEATIYVLKVQAQVEIKPGKIYVKKDTAELSGDISGVIGLVSDSFSGNVIITFPEKMFLTLMSKILREDFTAINKENADGAGELTNMIFGQAKITLNEQGYGIKTALPSLIIGKSHHFTGTKQELVVVVPFESEIGNFFVEICLSDNQ